MGSNEPIEPTITRALVQTPPPRGGCLYELKMAQKHVSVQSYFFCIAAENEKTSKGSDL